MNQIDFLELENEIIACRKCPRLVAWREKVGVVKRRAFCDQEYWARPVPGFGDTQARILIVGLAPGAHGSNRTGRMFTGDTSGDFLYPALYRAGFASQPRAFSKNDDLRLKDIFITAVCRCVPPDNKPEPSEMIKCRSFLEREITLLHDLQGIVALGKIAYDAVIRLLNLNGKRDLVPDFGHGVNFYAGGDKPWILCTYHPSRQNTQTGRLTTAMFDQIWTKAREMLVN